MTNNILNLFLGLIMISAISARLFNDLIIFFIMCVYSLLLCIALSL